MTLVRIAVIFYACITTSAAVCNAQSLATASKGAEISAFGGYSPGSLDYGPYTLKGFSAGGDFTLFPRFFLKPSIEGRANLLSAPNVTEKTVLFGPRLQLDPRQRPRLHPYADFFIGGGEILYHPPVDGLYSGDRSTVYSYGGGIDIDIEHHFSARFDFQQQSWNLGKNGVAQPNGSDFTLAPRNFTIGVKYAVPFRFLKRVSDYR